MNDFFVELNEDGIYDLFVENGQLKTVFSFDTVLQMIIHGERRADISEVPLPQYRRGWLGNEILYDDGFENGSKLWLLEQERRTPAVLTRAIDYIKQATQWLIDDGHLQSVDVQGSLITDGIQLIITYTTLENVTESKYYSLWANTGVRSIKQKASSSGILVLDSSGSRLMLSNGVFLRL